MTIDEAINMLDRIAAQDEDSGRPECVEAEKLGIEALKALYDIRQKHPTYTIALLPGETANTLTMQEQSLKRDNEILALGRKIIKETDELLSYDTSPPEGLMPRLVVPPSG